jgi:hypothetical protein
MNSFVQRHSDVVIGQLNGFDRIRLRGSKRLLCNLGGMFSFLWQVQVLLKDFKDYAMSLTDQLRQATVQVARDHDQEVRYLPSSSSSKEDLARAIAMREGIDEGLIAIFSAVEPCWSYHIHRNRDTRQLDLVGGPSKCLHYYHYYQHPQLGFMHVRMQTWFPFTVHICLNGREWLARQMDAEGLAYSRAGNCFLDLADVGRAQQLMDRQLRTDWPTLLNSLVASANPVHEAMFPKAKVPYYWSVQQSEWAGDVMFRSAADLSRLYPRLLAHGMTTLDSPEVMRFLGRKVPAHGGVNGNFTGQVVTDLRQRPEGVRLKHHVNGNSVKMYNKQGSVLRTETTINQPRDFQVYRPKEGDPGGEKAWRYMRRGVADLHRRAQVSGACNDRYLEAMATVESGEPLAALVEPLCRPVTWKAKRMRALNPMSGADAALLAAVARGEFLINGFRNRDLRRLLYGEKPVSRSEQRRRSSAVTRQLRLLRAHGLIRKVPHTHRYVLSPKGRKAIHALLSARQADTAKLTDAA